MSSFSDIELDRYIKSLPAPLCGETYREILTGIWDDPDITVYMNDMNDFAFLFPTPQVDYQRYVTRTKKLGLEKDPKRFQRRFDKCESWLSDREKILEIGTSDGSFLRVLRKALPLVSLSCIEPDASTQTERSQIADLTQFDDLAGALQFGEKYDAICHFHVFEHVTEPTDFLSGTRALLSEEGIMIMEIPSLDDPLMSLYRNPNYQKFFFQKQHPFSYTRASLMRVLKHYGFAIRVAIPHQRYGLDNHMTWMQCGKPGGSNDWRTVLGAADDAYRRALEKSTLTDSVIIVASLAKTSPD